MPSESKVPAAAVIGSSGSSGDALEEVTIDVQQMDATSFNVAKRRRARDTTAKRNF